MKLPDWALVSVWAGSTPMECCVIRKGANVLMTRNRGAGCPAGAGCEEELRAAGDTLRRELEQARQEAAESRELYLRALADKENSRKRLERLYEERLAEARRALLRRILTVADDLERALAHQDAGEALVEGVRLTYRQLQNLLQSEGVERVEVLGQPFNPAEHEAVALVEGPEPPGTVVGEELRGYRLGEHLLRPAHVRVVAGEPD
jgi:molecular chaperone GrpE